MTNPLYWRARLRAVAEEKLKDPQRLPLFIAIDAFMNETTALADYIVPDTHNFESWGFSAPWAGVASKATTARWPVVPAATAKPLTVSQRQWKHFALRWRSVLICQDLAKTPLPMLRVTAIHSTGLRTITCAWPRTRVYG
jgi:anaerobic selenocysteine-containing dehydrogenase